MTAFRFSPLDWKFFKESVQVHSDRPYKTGVPDLFSFKERGKTAEHRACQNEEKQLLHQPLLRKECCFGTGENGISGTENAGRGSPSCKRERTVPAKENCWLDKQAVHFLLDCIELGFCKKFVLRCCCRSVSVSPASFSCCPFFSLTAARSSPDLFLRCPNVILLPGSPARFVPLLRFSAFFPFCKMRHRKSSAMPHPAFLQKIMNRFQQSEQHWHTDGDRQAGEQFNLPCNGRIARILTDPGEKLPHIRDPKHFQQRIQI